MTHPNPTGRRGSKPPVDAHLRLPDFLIIGAMKAGTTSLLEYLRWHPGVFVPPGFQEVGFFSDEPAWRRGTGWYASLFASAPPSSVIGERSTNYSKHPVFEHVAARIADLLPEARLIYLVRDPIARIRSHYLHNVSRGRERRPIEEAVRLDPKYIAASSYSTQIEQYGRWYPPQRLLVLTFDELHHNPSGAVGRVLSHIGATGEVPAGTFPHHNSTAGKRAPGPVLRIIRRTPAHAAARSLLPKQALRLSRRTARRTLTTELADAPAELSPRFRSELSRMLADEVRELRPRLGASFDGWGIG